MDIRNFVCSFKYNCKPGQRIKGRYYWLVGSTGRSEAHIYIMKYKMVVVNPLNFYYGNISAVEYVYTNKPIKKINHLIKYLRIKLFQKKSIN
jgi:nitric oxide synthase oxygenase domain/subunit